MRGLIVATETNARDSPLIYVCLTATRDVEQRHNRSLSRSFTLCRRLSWWKLVCARHKAQCLAMTWFIVSFKTYSNCKILLSCFTWPILLTIPLCL